MESKQRDYFEDANGDKSSSRRNQFLVVVGGIILTAIALFRGQPEAAIGIFTASAAAAGAVAWKSRDAESKEAIVDKGQPDPDIKTKVDA